MAKSVHESSGAKRSTKAKDSEKGATSDPSGSQRLPFGQLTTLSRHLADVAERLDAELRVSGSVADQFSELTQELKEHREAFLKAEVEIMDLRLQLQRDRDRRKRIEDELMQLRKALETMQLGVTIANEDGIIVYVNPADARIHGFTVDELLGKDVGVFAVGFQHKPLTLAKLRTLKSYQRETFNRRKDGSIFKVRLLSDVVRDSDGEPIGLVTMCEELQDTETAAAADTAPTKPKSAADTVKKKTKKKQ